MSDSGSSFEYDMVRELDEMENALNDDTAEAMEAFEQSYSKDPKSFLSSWRPQVPIFMTAQEVSQNIDIPDVPDFVEQHDESVLSIAADVDVIPEAKNDLSID